MNWYILQVYPGFENQIEKTIKEKAEKKGLGDCIKDILIPTEEALQMRYGKKNTVKRNLVTGYIFINMDLNDQLLHLIKSIPKVSNFLGSLDKYGVPFPVSQAEIDRMLNTVDNQNSNAVNNNVYFKVGEEIKIISGSFDSFTGIIQEIEEEKAKLKVSVSIFGRMTPVELEYNQVEKIKD